MKTSYSERDYTYGTAILTLRSAIGLTQEELARHLGISRQAVGKWEAGSMYPKAEYLKEVIALTVSYFISYSFMKFFARKQLYSFFYFFVHSL